MMSPANRGGRSPGPERTGTTTFRRLWRERRGAVIVLIATSLAAMLLSAGVVVDVGYWYAKKGQVQAMADMTAMSALGGIDFEDTAQNQALRLEAIVDQVTTLNELEDGFFTVAYEFDDPATPKKISKVTISRSHEMSAFFMRLVGMQKVTAGIQAVAERNQFLALTPPCAFFAKQKITYGGGGHEQIDSFNSTDGNYTAIASYDGKDFSADNAVGCANASVEFNGNVALFGDLYIGGSFDAKGGSGFVYGNVRTGGAIEASDMFEITQQKQPNEIVPNIEIPDATAPADIATNNDNNNIDKAWIEDNRANKTVLGTSVSEAGNKSIHLVAGGTYYFTLFNVTSQIPVIIEGILTDTTTIYLNGDAHLNGGVTFNDPGATSPTFKVIGLGSGHEFELGGNSKVVADIYAPDYDFKLSGTTHLQGTIWANNIDIAGTARFTYDEALGLKPVSTDTTIDRIHLVE